MGDLDGRTFCITGANTGIGEVTARELAGRGGRVLLACRSEAKTKPVLDAIARDGGDADFVALDLGDLGSVRTAATELLASGEPIHVLVNNAGLAGQRGQTVSGFELAFGVNHVGHFLLTTLLLDRIAESGPDARIVNVASDAHFQAKGIPGDDVLRRPTKTITGMREYAVSKLANVLFTTGLAARLDAGTVTANSLHPGVVATDVWRKLPGPISSLIKRRMLTPEQGARTTIHCATAPELAGVTATYFDDCAPKPPNGVVTKAAADELWHRSEAWVA